MKADLLPFAPPSRDDVQAEMIDALVRARTGGVKSTILNAPTAFGKTVCAAKYIRRGLDEWGGKFLFLVDEITLVAQTEDKFSRWGLRVGVEQAKRRSANAFSLYGGMDVAVATRQTLTPARLAKLLAAHNFTDIFLDECHVGVKGAAIKMIRAAVPDAFFIGLSATPFFHDGKSLAPDYFDSTAYFYPLRDYADGKPGAISNGHLCPPYWVERAADVDLSSLNTVVTRYGRDYSANDLTARITPQVERIVNLAREEMDRLGVKRAMCFAASIMLAETFAKAFLKAKVSAVALHGECADPERIEQDYRDGQYRVMVVCQKCIKGFDDPATDGLIMARPTQSLSLAWQMLGRGLRLSPGKTKCHVIGFSWETGASRQPLSTFDLFLEGLDEPTKAVARRIAGSGRPIDLMGLADQARDIRRAELAREAAARKAAKVVPRGFDLDVAKRDIQCGRRELDILGTKPATLQEFTPPAEPFGPPSLDQRRQMRDLGLAKPGAQMTSAAAQRFIREWVDRKEAGMASFKQCRLLKTKGVEWAESRNMNYREAGAAISRLCGSRSA